MKPYTHIIWDWNGTLLNDAWLCREAVNVLLERRGMPLLSLERYQEIFDFPLPKYYAAAGFNFEVEPFDLVGSEFLEEYHRRLPECDLHQDIHETLDAAEAAGCRQALLSAYQHDALQRAMERYRLTHRFEWVWGVNGHHAEGKIARGQALFEEMRCPADTTLLIGDTGHDAEVARAMGVECVLLARGNQARHRLLAHGVKVFDDLHSLRKHLEER